MKSGIYKIQSKIKPERFYIGSAVDIKQRWRDHKSELLRDKHHSIKMQNHVNKYGFRDLIFTVVEGVSKKEDLVPTEQGSLDAGFPYFNTARIAGSKLGIKHSEESKRKVSETLKGRKFSEEHRERLSETAKGRKRGKFSEEHKRNMSKARRGRSPITEETRQKISEAKKGEKIIRRASAENR